MKSDITENYTKKGGLNNKPISDRPSPPIGQGTQSTDKQQPQYAICPNCKNTVSIRNLEALLQCPHCKIDYPQKGWVKQHTMR